MKPAEVYERLHAIDHKYSIKELDDYFEAIGELPVVKNNKKQKYVNCAAMFDTEAFSFKDKDGNKVAAVYEWTLNINGLTIAGRSLWEFCTLVYNKLVDHFKLADGVIFPLYVHNLSYDFQFIRRWFNFTDIFALDRMEPIRATTAEGVEFRCSYKLAGLSLAIVGKNLTTYTVRKMVGDLDYDLPRHSGTPLTEKEWEYCFHDCEVGVCFILEEIAQNGDITKIPSTKTGYVRRYVKKQCFGNDIANVSERNKQYNKYTKLMQTLTLTVDEYKQLRRAFAGGFTHASNWTVCRTQTNVTSYDECSAYPAQMLSRKFPMSKPEFFETISKEEFSKSLRLYCCLFDAHFIGLKQKRGAVEHVLSSSKCSMPKGTKHFLDNGKVVFADEIYTTLTETDFRVLKQFYKWDKLEVANFRRYRKDYLPTEFVKAILKLYVDKTALKGVIGREAEYQLVKGMLNSAYGMCVTNIVRDIITYDPGFKQWNERTKPDLEEVINRYNKSKNRFLSYAWGVWVTSYAREAILLYGVKAVGDDYCYSDTDSVKFTNGEKYREHFEAYNAMVTERLDKAMKHHGIDVTMTRPKTKKGVEKPLGIFECEGTYLKFKSNGAKRYLVEHEDHELVLTVSGLNKKDALIYMLKETRTPYHIEDDRSDPDVKHIIADDDTTTLFEFFDSELSIPAGSTGKNKHFYFDNDVEGELTDYLGNKGTYYEKSGVHLAPDSYSSNEAVIWLEYIFGKAGIMYAK